MSIAVSLFCHVMKLRGDDVHERVARVVIALIQPSIEFHENEILPVLLGAADERLAN